METTAERNIEAHIKSAAKIEPDRLPRLKLLAEDWADAIAAGLNLGFAAPVDVEFSSVASFAFSATAADIEAAIVALPVRSAKWRDTGFVLADARLADIVAEAMLGGSGRSSKSAARAITKLDRRFVGFALAKFVETGNAALAYIESFDMKAGAPVDSAIGTHFDEIIPADGRAFVMLSFRISISGDDSVVRFAVPERVLAPHRRKLTTMPEIVTTILDERWARDITEGLQHADLEVRALLDQKQISLGEVARFQLGQTIMLDATMDSLIIIECEEQRLFRGRMGVSRDSYMVRIEEKIDPTEEFIDDILSD